MQARNNSTQECNSKSYVQKLFQRQAQAALRSSIGLLVGALLLTVIH